MNVPPDLRYTKTHEWVRVEGDTATIGITDFAQKELGDIVFVELPNPGRSLGTGDTFGTIESVKAVSEIYAPFGGEVTAANEALAAQSELVNSDPYGAGWLIKVRVADVESLGTLLDAGTYESLLG